MTRNRSHYAKKGKVKISILILSFFTIAFFIFIGLPQIYTQSITNTRSQNDNNTSRTTTPVAPVYTQPITTPSLPVPTPPTYRPQAPSPVQLPPAQNMGHIAGISAGGNLSKMSATELNKHLDEMVALGVTWVRFDIEWGLVQYNSADEFTWGSYDNLIKALNDHNLKGLAIILFTPRWARDPNCGGGAKCPPRDPNQYAEFAANVVARYKDQGLRHWEIWNEPNNYDFWATKTNCVAYTTLLKATYNAIKTVDPGAFVVSGGLSPAATDHNNIAPIDFLNCIYKNGGKGHFDAVGNHPYTFPKLPTSHRDNTWGQMAKTSPSLRSLMIANGDGDKKIWLTEFGLPTNGPDSTRFVSEQVQSDTVVDAMREYKNLNWAGPIFWYTLKDGGITTNTIENFFGLVRFDWSRKPAFYTLKDIIFGEI